MVVTQAEIAKRAHKTPAAISLAIKRGLLLRKKDGGIDENDPLTVAYLKTPSDQGSRPSGKIGKKSKQKPVTSPRTRQAVTQIKAETVNIGSPAESASMEIVDLNVAIKHEDLVKKRLANEITRGSYIGRELVRNWVMRWDSVLTSLFLTQPERITPGIDDAAMKEEQTQEERRLAIKSIIRSDVYDSLEAMKKALLLQASRMLPNLSLEALPNDYKPSDGRTESRFPDGDDPSEKADRPDI